MAHRYLFVQRRLSPSERATLQRICRGWPQLRSLRRLMEEVYRLFDRRCRMATALAKLEKLRARLRRFGRLRKVLKKLLAPRSEKALVFLDKRLLGTTSNAVERGNRRYRKMQKNSVPGSDAAGDRGPAGAGPAAGAARPRQGSDHQVFAQGWRHDAIAGALLQSLKPLHFSSDWLWRSWTAEHIVMPGIIEFPKVVQDALDQYGDLFANRCQRRHLAEYLTGLFVAQRKTVLGIHDEFAQTTDQSCLNRFMTEVPWDVQTLNQRRLERLQEDPFTRYSDHGVIAIDNTLIDRDGQLIPDAGWFWDHAEERNKIAQDYLFINYVCTSGKHYPLEFRLFRKQEICEALKQPFRNHTVLCCELIDWVCERNIPGDFTMDCYFTSAEVLNHVHAKTDRFGRPRGYVGDLKTNRNLEWKGRIVKASDLAA